jgi:hypothetical protein
LVRFREAVVLRWAARLMVSVPGEPELIEIHNIIKR